ncbi:hypothetical protein V6932_004708 [Vibrio alginolyticus]
MLEVIKYSLILFTAVIAICGVKFDYKTKGKLNFWGKFVIGILVVLGIASAVSEYLSNRKQAQDTKVAAEQLERENLQRKQLINRLKVVEESIKTNITYLEGLKKQVSNNFDDLKLTQSSIQDVANLQLKQQEELDTNIHAFSKSADLQLRRLSRPIKELYLSSSLKFLNFEKNVNSYYQFLKPDLYHAEGNYITSKKEVPEGFDYQYLHYLHPTYLTLGLYKYQGRTELTNDILVNLKPELELKATMNEGGYIFDGLYSNLDDASVIKNFDMLPLKVNYSKGSITSQLDIVELASQGDYAVFSFTSTYPELVDLTGLELHTDNNQFSGVSLDNCTLIYRRSSLNIVLSDVEKLQHFTHKYSCKLWEASNLRQR